LHRKNSCNDALPERGKPITRTGVFLPSFAREIDCFGCSAVLVESFERMTENITDMRAAKARATFKTAQGSKRTLKPLIVLFTRCLEIRGPWSCLARRCFGLVHSCWSSRRVPPLLPSHRQSLLHSIVGNLVQPHPIYTSCPNLERWPKIYFPCYQLPKSYFSSWKSLRVLVNSCHSLSKNPIAAFRKNWVEKVSE
jgi:hypothetical protein